MKILLMHPASEKQAISLSKYCPELIEVEQPKRNRGIVKPIPIEELVNMKLFSNNAQIQTTYEKFIGHKIKTA